jgi:hypothetical protein
MENAPARATGRFAQPAFVATAAIVGIGAAALFRRGRRAQADAARTRPPSPPKLVRAARPFP